MPSHLNWKFCKGGWVGEGVLAFADRSVEVGVVGSTGLMGSTTSILGIARGEIVGGNAILVPVPPAPPLPSLQCTVYPRPPPLPLQCTVKSRLPIRQAAARCTSLHWSSMLQHCCNVAWSKWRMIFNFHQIMAHFWKSLNSQYLVPVPKYRNTSKVNLYYHPPHPHINASQLLKVTKCPRAGK